MNTSNNNQYFIRTKGKSEFKTYHFIQVGTFKMLDDFFSSVEDAKEYARKKDFEIVEYCESFEEEMHGK